MLVKERLNNKWKGEEGEKMSEEAKKALEELVKVTEGNELAKAFLEGYKSGIKSAAGAQAGEQEKKD